MLRRPRLIALWVVLLLPAFRAGAGTDIPETRTHYTVAAADGTVIAAVTRITKVADTWDRDYVLFRTVFGDEFIVESGVNYEGQTSEFEVRTIKDDAWIVARLKTPPFTHKTRVGAMAEAQQNPHIFKLTPEHIELETNAGSWKEVDPQQPEERMLRLTADVRRSVAFDLLEMIERSANFIFVLDLGNGLKRHLLPYVLYHAPCDAKAPSLSKAAPDCDFDSRFGFPCSTKQQRRVRDAEETGIPLERY